MSVCRSLGAACGSDGSTSHDYLGVGQGRKMGQEARAALAKRRTRGEGCWGKMAMLRHRL